MKERKNERVSKGRAINEMTKQKAASKIMRVVLHNSVECYIRYTQ